MTIQNMGCQVGDKSLRQALGINASWDSFGKQPSRKLDFPYSVGGRYDSSVKKMCLMALEQASKVWGHTSDTPNQGKETASL